MLNLFSDSAICLDTISVFNYECAVRMLVVFTIAVRVVFVHNGLPSFNLLLYNSNMFI
jgi:hypothetical protein